MSLKLIHSKAPTILVANGVNLDLLGVREPSLYGEESLPSITKRLESIASKLAREFSWEDCQLICFQSNCESSYLEKLSIPWDAAIINPGAWTHTSLALGDRLKGLGKPYIEVHLSNILGRESFRSHSYIAAHSIGCIAGLGALGYELGLRSVLAHLASRR